MSTGSIKGWRAPTVNAVLRRNQGTAHSGLIFDRWLAIWDDGVEHPKTVTGMGSLKAFAEDFNRRTREPASVEQLKEHHERLARSTARKSRAETKLRVFWRFVSGLGAAHPTDNGFSFDPLLGVPCITGSAIKGLCRRAAKLSEAPDENRIETLLGPEEDQAPRCGDLVFYDALPLEWPKLVVDIVNCHHSAYYGALSASTRRSEPPSPPETEDPNPVFFLAVDHDSKFRFFITSRSDSKHNAEEGLSWLKEGVALLGIGAKTAVGYGTMAPIEAEDGGNSSLPRQTVWPATALAFNKGSGEIRGDHDGQKAFAAGKEAKTLVDSLSAAARGKLVKGRLKARLTVEPLGGKNWKIIKINLD